MKIPVWLTSQEYEDLKTQEGITISLTEDGAKWAENFDRVMNNQKGKGKIYKGTLIIEEDI